MAQRLEPQERVTFKEPLMANTIQVDTTELIISGGDITLNVSSAPVKPKSQIDAI